MSFLTQIKHEKRPFSSQHQYSQSATRQQGMKFIRQPVESTSIKSRSVHHVYSRRQISNMQLQKSIEAIKNKNQAKQKWQKILQMFHLILEVQQKANNSTGTTTPANNQCGQTDIKAQQLSSHLKIPFYRTALRAKSKEIKKKQEQKSTNKQSKTSFAKGEIHNSIEGGTSEKEHYTDEKEKKEEQPIKIQRLNLFQIILRADLSQRKYRFNVPETVLLDQQRNLQLITNQRQLLTKRQVLKSDLYSIFERGHEASLQTVKRTVNAQIFQQMYSEFINTKANPMAPFVVMCSQKQNKNLSMQVENARNFGQNRWDQNKSCYVQRFIFSRNLKAMVMRVVYDQLERGEQRKQYTVTRFQNYANIFRVNTNGCKDFLDFKAKVSPSFNREYTLQYSKLSGPGVLSRFIEPASEIKKLIENVTKKKVKKIWIDFIEDVSGKIWAISVKGVHFEELKIAIKKSLWQVAVEVGSCRLCSGTFQKSELQNSVSVRMLLQFLHHLKKRTRIQDLWQIDIHNISALNRKQKAMAAVCGCCYDLIIRQLQLKKYERQLGRLCNIRIQDDEDFTKAETKEMYQWRLMVYLEEIYQETKDFYGELNRKKIENVIVRYVLGKGMEDKWRCKVQKKKISVKRVKVHYFFSENNKIEDFLKNTQILFSVLSGQKEEKEEVIAQGSTSILANFRNKFVTENGQRQTTTVLLFFESGKYCALTLKVGLVFDGKYKVPQMPMKKLHSVEFPAKQCLNSNPLPKQWLQAIGFNDQIELNDFKYEDLIKQKPKISNGSKTGLLKKKTLRPNW